MALKETEKNQKEQGGTWYHAPDTTQKRKLDIRHRITEAYDKLVYSVLAENYVVSFLNHNISETQYEDCISEGFKGMFLAIDKHDPSGKRSFGKTAASYIMREITNYLGGDNAISSLDSLFRHIRYPRGIER